MPADSQYELVPLASQNEDIGQRDSNEDFQSTSESEPHENPKLSSRFDNITTSIFTFCAVVFAAVFFWRTFPSKMMEDDPSLARTANGTYRGLHSVERDQYLFLGMPYALPPVGTLRFAAPRHIESSWQDIRTAQAYGPHCLGYGDHQKDFNQSEDCLTINVVRPATESSSPLPVAVYIYGGGSHGGGTSDGRYNLSFIVSHATEHGMPFVAVSLNYRSSMWGFLAGKEAAGSANLNVGLRDQRLGLHWVQENIAAFNGDPQRVTIWGGSSGAEDVGLHLTAFGGRDDGLFRAAIMQSGSPVTRMGLRQAPTQGIYDELVSKTACALSTDTLACLREIQVDTLNGLFMDSVSGTSSSMVAMSLPALDGDFVNTYGSLSLKQSRFVKVPILSGVVSDEGSSWIPGRVRSWEEFEAYLIEEWRYPSPVVKRLLSFYPESDYDFGPLEPPIGSINDKGVYHRIRNVLGDMEIRAAQRLMCTAYSQANVPCYSFRFDALATSDDDPRQGVTHGMEIAPVFQNIEGLGFSRNPFEGKAQSYHDMADTMGLRWASFITHLDPNYGLAKGDQGWPVYDVDRPENLVFNETGPCWRELDVERSDAIDYINEIQHGIMDK